MKRLVSLLLGLLMVFMISTAMAETVAVYPGDTLEMTVSLSSASGKGMVIGIKTNDAPVTFVSAVGGEVNDTVPPKAFNDFFVVVNINGVDIKPDGTGLTGSLDSYTLSNLVKGVIGTLTFQVDKDAAEGTYTVEAYKESGSSTVNGSITFEVLKSKRVPGDVNEDGVFNIVDILMCLQKNSGWNVTINESNADVNQDGMFNIVDILMMLQKNSGWDVTLL